MTTEPPTEFTLRLDITVRLAERWQLRADPDAGTVAVDSGFSENFPPTPWTEAELLHSLREELMGTIQGSPFAITGIERVEW